MGFGDSLLLSMNGTGCSISGSAAVMNAAPAISKQGNKRCCVPRLAGCQKIYGFSSSLETRTVSNGSGKKAFAIRAAKSGSVDAPKSTNSSIGPAQVQSHLALLERMTENSTASQGGDDVMTIRDQLSSQVEPESSEMVVPLAKGEKEATPVAELTISQKRNIRRQNYLNQASERNDAPFFAAVAGLVLIPPILILAFAVATGYVEFFP